MKPGDVSSVECGCPSGPFGFHRLECGAPTETFKRRARLINIAEWLERGCDPKVAAKELRLEAAKS